MFISAPTPVHEYQRLEALRSYPIDYTLREKEFDDISRLAASICGVPLAMISLIEKEKVHFKSTFGFDGDQIKREHSFCQYTILSNTVYEIEDTHKHGNFKHNTFVLNEPYVRFYAGMPLVNAMGHALGSLCVLGVEPKKLTDAQKENLAILSRLLVNQMELKKSRNEARRAQEIADESSRAKLDFLSTMSHEIRTPLNGIVGISHLLMEEHLNPEQKEYVTTLKFSANHLMSLVNDILDYNKIEAGQISFEKTTYNLTELISDLKNSNMAKAHDKKIKINVKKDDDIPDMVIGDPVRLTQILSNLVNNAIKFTEKGEVSISLQLETIIEESIAIRFTVQDTGIGIPLEKQSDLFQWFSQVDTSITRKFGGSGLGLAISKRLLELQNSSIELKSKPDVGSEFSFILKFKLPENVIEEVKRKKPETLKSLGGLRVLLAEDNQVNALVASRTLGRWDITVTTAKNGEEAVKLAQTETFDLVMMDLQMPVMDGYEAAQQIRRLGFSSNDLPIIAFSASTLVGEQIQASSCGMDDFISKPFNPLDLYKKLEKYASREVMK